MIQKKYLSNKKLATQQDEFIKALQGIGDVLVFETKNKKNKNVTDGLKRLVEIVKKFLLMQENDPEKFERLLLSQEFFEHYSENEEEAKLRLSFDPDKYLISFSTPIDQILRIHEVAAETKNYEISRDAAYSIIYLLEYIAQKPGKDLLVEKLLRHLYEITVLAIEKQVSSMYAASTRWYINIVFKGTERNGGEFDLSYLELFDKFFFSSVKRIISTNQITLFKDLVSFLVDGVHIPYYHRGKIWDYGHLILRADFEKYKKLDADFKIEQKIKELDYSVTDLYTKEKLDIWLKNFYELKNILEPNFDEDLKKEAKTLADKIREFITSQFKHNNLAEIVFAIGAYCLFKQRAEYIKILWDYKQPSDANGHFTGLDIVPNDLDSVLNFYFIKSFYERKINFWEDHHGSKIYYIKYFLLLLARALKNIKPNDEGKYEQIEKYDLPKLHLYRLNDIGYSSDELIEVAHRLKKDVSTLGILGFDINRIDEIFDKKLIPFLQLLKIKAQQKIEDLSKNQPPNPKKIEEFKGQVIKSFNDYALLRNILKHYKLYEDKTSEKYKGIHEDFGFGISEVSDKAAFFEEWYVSYGNWGSQYGEGLALSENIDIKNDIISKCEKRKEKDFDNLFDKFNNLSDVIIFTINIDILKLSKNVENLKPQWQKDCPQLEVTGFEGWYTYMENSIPIFGFHHHGLNQQIMILNIHKIGNLIQYSPINNEEKENLKKDIFYMNIQAFSENEELMNKTLEKPPEWLKEIGDIDKQREHLKSKVLIEIFEWFEFNEDENFEGYLFELPE